MLLDRIHNQRQPGASPGSGFPSGRVISSKILSLGLDWWGSGNWPVSLLLAGRFYSTWR